MGDDDNDDDDNNNKGRIERRRAVAKATRRLKTNEKYIGKKLFDTTFTNMCRPFQVFTTMGKRPKRIAN